MAINLMAVKPNKVSRDLSGYITYIYGPAKAGKTTFASQTPGNLLLAFERGYNAIPGVMAQDITTWGQMKEVLRELKKPDVQAVFKTIVIDTVDIASTLCEKYVCSQNDVETLSQIPYGGGWTKVKREWEETFRTITQMGYAVVFISHSKDKVFKREDGSEYNQIIPTCPTTYNDIVKNMSDIIGYIDMQNGERKLVLRSLDNKVDVGCRFKNISPVIPFGYTELVEALNDAIDTEATATQNQFVTEARPTNVEMPAYNYDALMLEFQSVVGNLMQKDQAYYTPKITAITNKILGRGKKVSELNPAQVEVLAVVLDEVKALVD